MKARRMIQKHVSFSALDSRVCCRLVARCGHCERSSKTDLTDSGWCAVRRIRRYVSLARGVKGKADCVAARRGAARGGHFMLV